MSKLGKTWQMSNNGSESFRCEILRSHPLFRNVSPSNNYKSTTFFIIQEANNEITLRITHLSISFGHVYYIWRRAGNYINTDRATGGATSNLEWWLWRHIRFEIPVTSSAIDVCRYEPYWKMYLTSVVACFTWCMPTSAKFPCTKCGQTLFVALLTIIAVSKSFQGRRSSTGKRR